jgi:hypothetical protein
MNSGNQKEWFPVFFCKQAAKGRKTSSSFFVVLELVNTILKDCNSEGLGHKIVTLCTNNTRFGEFTHFQCLADFLGRQELHNTINLRRIGV